MKRVYPLVILIVLIAAAFIILSSNNFTANANQASSGGKAAPLQATSGVTVNSTAIPLNVDVGALGSPRVLAWNPNTSLLSWLAKDNKMAAVGKADTAKAIMLICNANPGGDKVLLFQGAENVADAQPYLLPINGGNTQPLGANIALSCALPGRIQFSPDNNRVGIMKFDNKTLNNAYAIGALRILKMPEGTEQGSIDGVASFDLQNDGAVAVQLFSDQKNKAKSADVIFWDGSKTRKIEENIQTLNQDEKDDCEFISVKVLRVNDKVYTLWGEKCIKAGSTWRIHRADFGGGNGVEVSSGPTGANGKAAYFNSTAGNELYLLPNGTQALFTVPTGIASNVVNIARIDLNSGQVSNVMSNVLVDQYPPTANQGQFLRSPKGDFLAMVTRNGEKSEQLYLYDLNSPDTAPKSVAGGGKEDQITGLAWTGDGQKLFYNLVSDTQALYSYTVKGESNLVARGTFSGLAVSPDGAWAATAERVKISANVFRNNFVLINTGDESKVNLVEGAKGDQPLEALLVR
jgi:hypothetical protein